MQMGDDEPKRARAENNKKKKKANNLLRGESRGGGERERFLQCYPKYPRQQTRSKGEEESSRLCAQEKDELLIFSERLSLSPVYLVSPQSQQQQHKPTIQNGRSKVVPTP